MATEEAFAREEARLGRRVHFHDGIWWLSTAPYYFKPVLEFRPFAPKAVRPHPLRSFLGYSHHVADAAQATRAVRRNLIDGETLRTFSLESLKRAKRNKVRQGLAQCVIKRFEPAEHLLEEMRLINIAQAKRFQAAGDAMTFLPPEYYERKAKEWRDNMVRAFGHQGHEFIGAFVGGRLAAYIDLVKVEDTWYFGAAKSREDLLAHRPIDALYFAILSAAAEDGTCARVVNGGPDGERATLTQFKEEFLLRVVSVPYYSHTLLPMGALRRIQSRLTSLRRGKPVGHLTEPAENSVENQPTEAA